MSKDLSFFVPSNDILKKYIEGYYFLHAAQVGKIKSYWTFPNNYCIVTINRNSSVTFRENSISIIPSQNKNIHLSVVSRYVSPIRVYYESPIDEITIYFKPLGIDQFLKDTRLVFSHRNMSESVLLFPDLKEAMEKIFTFENREQQISELEKYLLSKLIVKDLSVIEHLLREIESGEKIEDIAEKHSISRKHLNTLIVKNIGKSPVEYRKIHRFRNALNTNRAFKNLTVLTYENLFYDQSHLIKDFKSLTNACPKTFFKTTNFDNLIVWLLT
jgi:AraC-like DNA-binding protein